MLFYCKYLSHGEVNERIFDVIDEGDLYGNCHLFNLDIIDYIAITQTEENTDIFSHEKGGRYQVVSRATPAGDEARGFGNIIIYKDIVTGATYYRHWKDFISKMKNTGVTNEG